MYKKIIRRGENKYTYYYNNIRRNGKFWNIFLSSDKNEKEENGFLNQVDLFFPRIFYCMLFNYINISFLVCKAADAQLGRAPTLRVGSSQGMRVQNFHCEYESPVRGAQKKVNNV